MYKLPRLIIFAAALCCVLSVAQADKWRFIVTGDCRSNGAHPRAGMDQDGVNVQILGELTRAFIKEKPKLIMFSGDLVYGANTGEELATQLRTWLKVMKPVYDAGIKVYAVRGNHESYGKGGVAIWRKLMSGRYGMPDNGPKGEKDLTFSVSYKNALLVGFDQFVTDKARVNQTWLDETIKKHPKQHLFLMAHEMAFRAGEHEDNMDNDPAARDRFWNSIARAGGRTFFCGHDHLYDHTAFYAPGWPESKAIHQFIVGTAGAPFYHANKHDGANGDWQQTAISHIQDRFGYLVVDVDGPKVTLTFKIRTGPGTYSVADTWSYVVPVKAPKQRKF